MFSLFITTAAVLFVLSLKSKPAQPILNGQYSHLTCDAHLHCHLTCAIDPQPTYCELPTPSDDQYPDNDEQADLWFGFEPLTPSTINTPELSALNIRQLKKLASAAKVKYYSKMTKAELIEALS